MKRLWCLLMLLLLSACSVPERMEGNGTKTASGTSTVAEQQDALQQIPILAHPTFLPAKKVLFLEREEIIYSIVIHGAAKAYPAELLEQHPVIQDRILNIPILITYNPFHQTAIAYERSADNAVLEFSSATVSSTQDILLEDTAGGTWSQLHGKELHERGRTWRQLPLDIMAWEDWLESYPESSVLAPNQTGEKGKMEIPKQKRAAWVYGIAMHGVFKAYPEEEIFQKKLLEDAVASIPILLVVDLDSKAVRMFDRTMEEQALHFTLKQNQIYETATNSRFSFTGKGETRVYAGKQLQSIPAVRAPLDSWTAFHPDTLFYGEK